MLLVIEPRFLLRLGWHCASIQGRAAQWDQGQTRISANVLVALKSPSGGAGGQEVQAGFITDWFNKRIFSVP